MPTLPPDLITEYLVHGKDDLLNRAKQIIADATSYLEARDNVVVITTAIQSHYSHAHKAPSFLKHGFFGGFAYGMVKAALTASFLSPGTTLTAHIGRTVLETTAGGVVGGAGIDYFNASKAQPKTQKILIELSKLENLAQDKAKSFGTEEEAKAQKGELRQRSRAF